MTGKKIRVWEHVAPDIWSFKTESLQVLVHRDAEPDAWFVTMRPGVEIEKKKLPSRDVEEAKDQALDEVEGYLDRLAAEIRTAPRGSFLHVDDFVDDYQADPYARWMLLHLRLPAVLKMAARQFMADRRLFCTHQGDRYRVVMASRLGDIGLSQNFDQENGYRLRVPVTECSEWGDRP